MQKTGVNQKKRSKQQVKKIIPVVVFFVFIIILTIAEPVCSDDRIVFSNHLRNTKTGKAMIAAAEQKTVQGESDASDSTEEDDLDFLEDEEDEAPTVIKDTWEPFNRAMFQFNDKLYFWLLKPIAIGYGTILPSPIRIGIKNFLYNVLVPVRFANCLLQGKWKKAEAEFSRFMICTSFGIAGFMNPVKDYPELNPSAEDFGQTLGAWGLNNGIFINWPFLGPSTIRDSVGRVADLPLNPTFAVSRLDVSIAVASVRLVNNASFRIGDYEAIKEAALDPYVALRNAYVQNRNKKVAE